VTIAAYDVDSLNKPVNFATAFGQGNRACYIKLGGNNLSGNDPYLMTSNGGYSGQMNAAVAAGFQYRGSYWMSGGHDPVNAARFYLAHRDPHTTFDVLDNERIDAGNLWSDAEADAFFTVLAAAGCSDLWMYGSRLSTFATQAWPRLIARGVKAIVADYGNSPLSPAIVPSTYPSSLVKGHQYSSSETIGGISRVDADLFTDDAFSAQSTTSVREAKVAVSSAEAYAWKPVFLWAPGFVKHLATPEQVSAALYLERLSDHNYSDATEFQSTIWNYGLEEYTVDEIIELSITRNEDGSVANTNRGGMLVASWADVRKVSEGATPTIDYDALTTKLASKITVPTAFDITTTGKAVAA
jgi:hypothetical protein